MKFTGNGIFGAIQSEGEIYLYNGLTIMVKATITFVAIMLISGICLWIQKNVSDQQHNDYLAVSSMNISDIHVGQSINLQNYDVEVKSGDPSILQFRTSDNYGLLSDNKDIIWGASAGDTTLMICDKSSDAYKIIKVHVG